MKGMMYNIVYPCLLSLYIHELRMDGGSVTPPHVHSGGHMEPTMSKNSQEIRKCVMASKGMLWLLFPEAPGSSAPWCVACPPMSPQRNRTAGHSQRLAPVTDEAELRQILCQVVSKIIVQILVPWLRTYWHGPYYSMTHFEQSCMDHWKAWFPKPFGSQLRILWYTNRSPASRYTWFSLINQ